jgi:phospholipid/cholesterol/gamma-HCH transport system substrate-binding protein
MYARKTEFSVGIFMVVGIIALVYLSVSLGNINLGSKTYTATAVFDSITGLREGSTVEIAGVNVGSVGKITLENDLAVVKMEIDKAVKISDDSIASIRTKGVIGEKYIKLTPGGSGVYVEDGGSLMDTESAISLEELISKYIFEK